MTAAGGVGAGELAPASAPAPLPGPVPAGPTGRRWGALRRLAPLGWTGPALLLIAAVVVYPAVEMVRTSLERFNSIGLSQGTAGLGNYRNLLAEPALGQVVEHTLLWVALVVSVTLTVSLALAQFLSKRFALRRLVRWALIVPWAASLVMTATVWRYIFEGAYGTLNRVLLDLGVIHTPVYWYEDSATAFWALIAVGIIVSVPFTTYVLLAGLQSIPAEVHHAAAVDGAGPWRAYRAVTLPLLRPALVVAVVLNTIYVFNSFPIIWVITGKLPGDSTDTTVTFMYKIAFTYRLDVGEASALAVLNVAFLILVVGVYLWFLRRREGGRRDPLAGRRSFLRAVHWPVAGMARGLRRATSTPADHAVHPHAAPSPTSSHAAPSPPSAANGNAEPSSPGGAVPSPDRARSALAPSARRARTREVFRRRWTAVRPITLPAFGLVIAGFFLAPYVVMVLSALKSNQDLFHSPGLYLPTRWQWGNFATAWHAIPLASYMINSLIIAGVATGIVLVVSVPAAYYCARHSFRGRQLFLYAILVTQMFAPVALVVGIFREFDLIGTWLNGPGNGGAINSYWAIIAVDAGFNLAFAVWILHGYLLSIPVEIEEAAMVDGAGRARVLTRVVLPLAKPGLVTAVIFTFIQVWNEFVVAETIFDDPTRNRETLTVGINAFVGLYQTQYQYLFVASIIGIVPVVILFAAIERHLVSGLTAGAIR